MRNAELSLNLGSPLGMKTALVQHVVCLCTHFFLTEAFAHQTITLSAKYFSCLPRQHGVEFLQIQHV